MSDIKILDCTLRDGGYINSWQFGKDNIRSIISGLVKAGIEMIECGFLSEKAAFSEDDSRFNSPLEVDDLLPASTGDSIFVAMINYGEMSADSMPDCSGRLTGVRVAFHKKDRYDALELCAKLKDKGYKVFVQPMVAFSYTDEEYLELIRIVNAMKPYAFYIVDSHGSMKKEDVSKYYYLVETNLSADIALGFHSHNNLQLSYSNSQLLISKQSVHTLILDSSVFGMGRGAGNLNTELLTDYLNNTTGTKYAIKQLLKVVDNSIEPIYHNYTWGFSMPYYLSAVYRCHQNYAGYLRDKQTLTVEDMDAIFSQIATDKKDSFDKAYVESLYRSYQDCKVADHTAREMLGEVIRGRNIVVLAPGKSVKRNKDLIIEAAEKNNALIISVNHVNPDIRSDYVFMSNTRRYEMIKEKMVSGLIVTSNIREDTQAEFVLNYSDLLNNTEAVEDNVTLMLMELIISLGARSASLAGVDGYVGGEKNFFNEQYETHEKSDIFTKKNAGLVKMLRYYSQQIPLTFLTESVLDIDSTNGEISK